MKSRIKLGGVYKCLASPTHILVLRVESKVDSDFFDLTVSYITKDGTPLAPLVTTKSYEEIMTWEEVDIYKIMV